MERPNHAVGSRTFDAKALLFLGRDFRTAPSILEESFEIIYTHSTIAQQGDERSLLMSVTPLACKNSRREPIRFTPPDESRFSSLESFCLDHAFPARRPLSADWARVEIRDDV